MEPQASATPTSVTAGASAAPTVFESGQWNPESSIWMQKVARDAIQFEGGVKLHSLVSMERPRNSYFRGEYRTIVRLESAETRVGFSPTAMKPALIIIRLMDEGGDAKFGGGSYVTP